MRQNLFSIPAFNIDKVKNLVESLNKKAEKFSLPLVTLSISEAQGVTVTNDLGQEGIRIFYKVSVNIPEVKINGWKFLGSIVHGQAGNVILKNPSLDVIIPQKFYTSLPACEHCNLTRARKDSFLIINEAGIIRQIGKNCLSDYIGHNVESILRLAEIVESLSGLSDYEETAGTGSGRSFDGWNLLDYLSFVCLSISLHGWNSRTKARENGGEFNTADNALYLLDDRQGKEKPSKDNLIEAQNALIWIKTVEPLDNDYLINLTNAVKFNFVTGKTAGIIASLIPAYRKNLLDKTAKETAEKTPSNFYGQVKDKITVTLTYQKFFSFENDFGLTYIHFFKDDTGNIFIWKTQNGLINEAENVPYTAGNRINLKGTIKEHTEYKGIKQTVLTRCKVLTEVTK